MLYLMVVNNIDVQLAHTSSSLVLDQSNFEQYSDGITFRGDYASSTQYRLNDLVKYGGRTYRVTTEHTSAQVVTQI